MKKLLSAITIAILLASTSINASAPTPESEGWFAWGVRLSGSAATSILGVVTDGRVRAVVGSTAAVSVLAGDFIDTLPYGAEARSVVSTAAMGLFLVGVAHDVVTAPTLLKKASSTVGAIVRVGGHSIMSQDPRIATALTAFTLFQLIQPVGAKIINLGGSTYPGNTLFIEEGQNNGTHYILNAQTNPVNLTMGTPLGTVEFSTIIPGTPGNLPNIASYLANGANFTQTLDGTYFFTGTREEINAIFSSIQIEFSSPNQYGVFHAILKLWEGEFAAKPISPLGGRQKISISFTNDAPSAVDGMVFEMKVDGSETLHPIPGSLAYGFSDARDGDINPAFDGLSLDGATINMRCIEGVSAINVAGQPCNGENPSLPCAIDRRLFLAGGASLTTPAGSQTPVICSLSATEGGRDPLSSGVSSMNIHYKPAPDAPNLWNQLLTFQKNPYVVLTEVALYTIGYNGFYKGLDRNNHKYAKLAAEVNAAGGFGLWFFARPIVSKSYDFDSKDVNLVTNYRSTLPFFGQFIPVKPRFQTAVDKISTFLDTNNAAIIAHWILESGAVTWTGVFPYTKAGEISIFGRKVCDYKRMVLNMGMLLELVQELGGGIPMGPLNEDDVAGFDVV